MTLKIERLAAATVFFATAAALPAFSFDEVICDGRAQKLPGYLSSAQAAAEDLNRVTSSIIVDLSGYSGVRDVCETTESMGCMLPGDAIDLIHQADRRFGRAFSEFSEHRKVLNYMLDSFQVRCIDKGHASIKGGLAPYYWPEDSETHQTAGKARVIVRAELARLHELRGAFEGDLPTDEDNDDGYYD